MLKKIFLYGCLFFFSSIFYANAQHGRTDGRTPLNIIKSFYGQYPAATVLNCREKKNVYIIKFKSGRKKHTACYDGLGNWLVTETKVSFVKKLPENIRISWRESGYRSWYIRSITEIQKPDSSYCLLDIDNSSLLDANHIPVSLRELNLYIDNNGCLLKKTRVAD